MNIKLIKLIKKKLFKSNKSKSPKELNKQKKNLIKMGFYDKISLKSDIWIYKVNKSFSSYLK